MQGRPERVAASIRNELARLLRDRMQDPRMGFVTVTGVKVSPDLRHARVFVSMLDSGASRDDCLAALTGARGWLRTSLSRALHLRRTPDLEFRLDDAAERGERMDRLLEQTRRDSGSD